MQHRLVAAIGIAMIFTSMVTSQVRDTGVQTADAAEGSGVLAGTIVTDTATPQPIRRATVRLSGESSTTVLLVGTDDDGHFRFDRLPAGTYVVSAAKAGFVRSFHGSSRPGVGPGVPVAVGNGEKVDIAIRLLAGAVITGVVTNTLGRPVQGITVTAVAASASVAAASPPVRAVSDDRGIYRIFGLAPGAYVVSALPPQFVPTPGGRGGPFAAEVAGITDAEMQWAKNLGAAGTVGSRSASQPPPPSRPVGYAPVFYPGTSDAAGATPIRVASGEEYSGIDVPLRIVTLARVAGTLADARGQAVTSAMVLLVPERGDRMSLVDALVSAGVIQLPRASVSATGFVFSGVAPGAYTLIARTGSGQRGAAPAEAAAPTLWSVADLAIDGTDRTDLSLRLLPGLSVTGRYIFEPGAAPADPATMNLSFVAINPIPGVTATFRAAMQKDGTFRVPSLAPGTYFARIEPQGTDSSRRWFLKSAVTGGRDLADRPLAAAADGSEVSNVVVTFSNRTAEISGRVIDAGNQPVTRYTIVVATTDRSLWSPGARRVRAASPATDGSFAVSDLPAGEYAVAAVQDLNPADLASEEFLTRLLASAFKLTLADGEKRQQDLRAGR
jgi:carboxypeptidase family protein